MFKTDPFLGHKKLSLNQNVLRDHANAMGCKLISLRQKKLSKKFVKTFVEKFVKKIRQNFIKNIRQKLHHRYTYHT